MRCTLNAECWSAAGHDLSVITRRFKGAFGDPDWVLRMPVLPARWPSFLWRFIEFMTFMLTASVAALFMRRQDVVVVSSPHIFAGVAGLVAARRSRCPLVFEVRDLWPDSITALGALENGVLVSLIRMLEQALYRKSSLVVVVTERSVDLVAAKGVPRDKILLVRNGADLERFKPGANIEVRRRLGLSGSFVAGYLGTFGVAQRSDLLIGAAEILKRRAPDIRLLIVGGGALRESLQCKAHDLGLDNILFHDTVPPNEIVAYWQSIDAALSFLADAELFQSVVPSKVFEAFATGTPLVTNVRGELTDIFEQNDLCPAISANTPEEVADALIRLRDDATLREALGQSGHELAKNYDRRTEARKMLDRIEALSDE